MKRIIYLLLLIPISISAQKIQTYSGSFEDGTAIYQYYENEQYDRIFQGSFIYKGELYDMNGNFNNGKRDGKWVISAKERKATGYSGTIIVNANIFGMYKNGFLYGDWIYENSFRFSNNPPSDNDKEISKAKFIDNHFVDKVTYQSNWPIAVSVQGNFDNEGFMTGVWLFKTGTIKDEIRFDRGIACWRVTIDTTNGNKTKFADNTVFVKSFWENIDLRENISVVNDKKYYLDTLQIGSSTRVPDIDISTMDVGDPWQPVDESYNPICLWSENRISLFHSGSISNPLYYYDSGCSTPVIYQKVIKECDFGTDCYKRLLTKENNKKMTFYIKLGDSLFTSKNFGDALIKYKSAKELDNNNSIINDKISQTDIEINKIKNLHNERERAYAQIKKDYNSNSLEASILYPKLLKDKEIYGQNFYKCTDVYSNKFDNYFSQIDSLVSVDNFETSKRNNYWTSNDQKAYDLILRFNNELNEINKFVESVKTAFETTNKEKLKILGSKNDEPQTIINYFLTK